MGTVADRAACAAVCTRSPGLKVTAQGNIWIIRGERFASAAWTMPRMP